MNQRGPVAAFFDLDGTLISLPSLEKRFFRALCSHREIPFGNYLLWLRETLRHLPRGISTAWRTNKMYLHDVRRLTSSGESIPLSATGSGIHEKFSTLTSGPLAEGQPSATPPTVPHHPRWPVPRFLKDAVARVAWHAEQGHALVIVSGTLEPLAKAAAQELERELAWRGFPVAIPVCATKLEEIDDKWTGRIEGQAMFGEAKRRAVERLAHHMQLNLRQCYAYGDTAHDEAMLASVGNPIAVNPSPRLAGIAWLRNWVMLKWKKENESTERTRGGRTTHSAREAKKEVELQQAEPCA